MCQSHGTFPGVLAFRVGTPRVHTVPGSPLRDEEQAWKRPCSPDPEPGFPTHRGGGEELSHGDFPKGLEWALSWGQRRTFASWLRWGIPMDFTVPMGGAYCFPKAQSLREKKARAC